MVVIVGPTGVGKTSLSITLAKRFNGEIISADSRQVYTGLDIGTEKISTKSMRGIPHHLIDVASPKKTFSADDFRVKGESVLNDILKRGKVPMVVGGTGFYIKALIDGQTLPQVPPNLSLRRRLESMSAGSLYTLLKKKDPRRAKTIDAKNPRRLIRALEIIDALGKVPETKPTQSNYHVLYIGLLPSKNYERDLQARLQKQLKQGLLREIKSLLKNKVSKKRIREFGLEYRTGLEHLEGLISKKDMETKMLLELRQYSKRQMTWFKANKDIIWFEMHKTTPRVVSAIRDFLQ